MLCFIGDMGCSQQMVELTMAAGIVKSDRGIFVTSFGSIHELDTETGSLRRDALSSPLFNALHSISRTRRGYLVASTGLDLLVEFGSDGAILWTWWATDHDFEYTPTGQLRVIDKAADHRTLRYGTLSQTTHVNAAAELHDGRFLATLFHQGMVIAIDRTSGEWQSLLEGLDHPHAVQVLDEEHFTVADTVRGRALLVRLNRDKAYVEEEIEVGTSWLQACHYDVIHNCWVLVDGKHSRIILRRGRAGKKALAQFDFDPEWRLYEAQVV